MSKRENRIDCALILGLVLSLMLTPLLSFGAECRQLEQQVLRLHILANSDSPQDQQVKLAVRDAVLAGTQGIFSEASGLEEAEAQAAKNLDLIRSLAQAELTRQGYPPLVKAELCNMYFDTRLYENATLPAGRYEALRLTLGEGAGKNWWCVVFPPLCVEAATKEQTPLTEKLAALDERPDYKLAFASVEFVEGLCEKLRLSNHKNDEIKNCP